MAFFATAHGKGPCAGVGGTLKRLIARASLQRPYEDQIVTPRQFYAYAKECIPSIHVEYFTENDWQQESKLCARFAASKTIKGTQKLHAIRPINQRDVQVAAYSRSKHYRVECVVRLTK